MKNQTKYEKIINDIENESYEIQFDETLAKTLIKLEDAEKASKFTDKQWEELFEKATNGKSLTMFLAMSKSPELPEKYLYRLYDFYQTSSFLSILLTNKNLPDNLIDNITEDTLTADKVKEEGYYYSDRVINFLCNDVKYPSVSLARYLQYAPFEFINEKGTNKKILNKILENKNNEYFDQDIPIELLYAIINNINLPDDIRNKAFGIEFNPFGIVSPTEYMKNELYKVYADTIFDITPSTKEEQNLINSATKVLSVKMSMNELTPSQQIDFINRFVENPNEKAFAVANAILKDTNDPLIALKMLEFDKSKKITANALRDNPKIIALDVMTEIIKQRHYSNAQKIFIDAVSYNNLGYDIPKEFLKFKDIEIDRAIITSPYVSDMLANKILNNYKDTKHKKDFEFLNHINKEFNKLFSKSLTKVATSCAVKCIINKTNSNTKNTDTLLKRAEIISFENAPFVYTTEYPAIKSKIGDIKKEFPEYAYICNEIDKNITQLYKNTELMLNYAGLFSSNVLDERKQNVPFTRIDIEKLYSLDEQGIISLDDFTKRLKKTQSKDIAEMIKYGILDRCCAENQFTTDIAIKTIYKLNDLYNVCDEIIKEQERESATKFLVDNEDIER